MPGGDAHSCDIFECAIHSLPPVCEYCGVKAIGHGVEADGRFFCCAHCASMAGAEGVVDRAQAHSTNPRHSGFGLTWVLGSQDRNMSPETLSPWSCAFAPC